MICDVAGAVLEEAGGVLVNAGADAWLACRDALGVPDEDIGRYGVCSQLSVWKHFK